MTNPSKATPPKTGHIRPPLTCRGVRVGATADALRTEPNDRTPASDLRPVLVLSLNPWIGDFERSSAVLVRCGRGVDLPGACVIGWPVPAFPCCEVPRVGPGVAGGQGLDGGVRRHAVVRLGSR